MNHLTNRQIIMLCVLSMGAGALFSPPLKGVAQPPESQAGSSQKSTSPTPSADSSRTLAAVGTITGEGTASKIAKFTAPNSIGNSLINEYSGKIGIGTTTATAQFNSVNTAGIGVYGFHNGNAAGSEPGVRGDTTSNTADATGVLGWTRNAAPGGNSAGVRGINSATNYSGYGVYGSHAGYGAAVYGTSINGVGTQGSSTTNSGIRGNSKSGSGVYGTSSSGVGVYGYSDDDYGTYGYSRTSHGVYGSSYDGNGVYGTSNRGYAGYFLGLAHVTGSFSVGGTLSKSAGSFKIDHPQHPATEYLSHSFVESPDMMNVYNGNITTNAKGEALVTLPKYFQSLNRDFRYQLTPIGQFAQAIVGEKIKDNHFLIRTDKPNVEVSWQVTGIRNDAFARQNRIRVEEKKTGADRGHYLYPAGFGFGKDKQIGLIMPRIAKR